MEDVVVALLLLMIAIFLVVMVVWIILAILVRILALVVVYCAVTAVLGLVGGLLHGFVIPIRVLVQGRAGACAGGNAGAYGGGGDRQERTARRERCSRVGPCLACLRSLPGALRPVSCQRPVG